MLATVHRLLKYPWLHHLNFHTWTTYPETLDAPTLATKTQLKHTQTTAIQTRAETIVHQCVCTQPWSHAGADSEIPASAPGVTAPQIVWQLTTQPSTTSTKTFAEFRFSKQQRRSHMATFFLARRNSIYRLWNMYIPSNIRYALKGHRC